MPHQTPAVEGMEGRLLFAAPVGAEFRANVFTTNHQRHVSIDFDDAGNFVMVWTSEGQDGSLGGIYARRFNAGGVPLGEEFRVNNTTLGNQLAPDVAVNASGDFVVVWAELPQLIDAKYDVYARAYNSEGAPQGNPFIPHFLSSAGHQIFPNVAIADSGRFVVSWRDEFTGVRAQMFSRYGGGGEGAPIQVSDTVATFHEVAMTGDERMVFTWEDGSVIRARIFDEVDHALGPSFVVNSYTTSLQGLAIVAVDGQGNFVVAWEGSAGSAVDTYGIHARRFDSMGTPLGDQFLVNTYTTQSQTNASIAMNDGGDFLIAWTSSFQESPGGSGIYAQQFHADGSRKGSEFHVNTYMTGTQDMSAAGMAGNGDFAIAWTSESGQDGDLSGVYAQRFLFATPPRVLSASYAWLTSPHRIEIVFDQNISGSLALEDIQFASLNAPWPDLSSQAELSWNAALNAATITFTTMPLLPAGRYTATIAAGDIENTDGEFMSENWELSFHFLPGDANHDGLVNLRDLMAVATHWQQNSNLNYSLGDFDYNGIIDAADLGILGLNWQKSLDSLAPALPVVPTSTVPRAPTRIPTRTSAAVIELVAEPVPTPSPVRSATR